MLPTNKQCKEYNNLLDVKNSNLNNKLNLFFFCLTFSEFKFAPFSFEVDHCDFNFQINLCLDII